MLDQEKAHITHLLALLQQLDQRLEAATKAAQSVYGIDAEQNPYRGIQIDQDEIEQLLHQAPGTAILNPDGAEVQGFASSEGPDHSRLAWLRHTFGLSDFDIAILAIALAPELDRRYERLYAYLQDDVRSKRPTVDLSLNVLCTSAIDKLTQRVHFSPDAPLIRHGLLHLIPDPNQPQPSLLAHIIKLDPQVIRLLLGERGLDERLSLCQLITPQIQLDQLALPTEIKQSLPALVQADWSAEKSLTIYCSGTDRSEKRNVAEAIAHSLQCPLLLVNLAKVLDAKGDVLPTLKLLIREAQFQTALLYIEELDALQTPDHAILYRSFLNQLADHRKVTILAGIKPWNNADTNIQGVIAIDFPMPDFDQRRVYWMSCLHRARTDAHIDLDVSELDVLSDRFRLTAHQIADAVITATNQVRWQLAERVDSPSNLPASVGLGDLCTAARGLSGHDLNALSQQIHPKYRWDDLVLPVHQMSQLREICDHVKYQHVVWQEWGFGQQRSLGKGLNVMFAGAPGTGKTMAAEVIAQELQLDLYKIDLSQMVSKYIGETEKNLNRIFSAATNANAILLFDEADALFGKRSDVKDAHDRYANLEVSYLLQKMEEYEGVAILTTNLRGNMDDAFVRRLRFIIEFPFPTEKQRYQIWQNIFPKLTPCSAELDLNSLARNFELTGANIRNIALAAAFLAAAEESPITTAHVTQAVRREYQKMGKILRE